MRLLVIISLAIALFLSTTSISAHTITRLISGPTFQVNAGFDGRFSEGNWIPVQISLRNDGADFNGTISITASNAQLKYAGPGNPVSPSSYQEPVTLPNGSQKQVTLYVPLYYGAQSITVNLLDSNGNVVRSQNTKLNSLNPGDIFVGILSDSTTGFGPLAAVSLPNTGNSVITDFLTASTLPDRAEVIQNFNLIVLDNFSTRTLSQKQLSALQIWVHEGGTLLAIGGPEWQRTLSGLPSQLLPVTANGTTTLPPGTSLLPIGGPSVGDTAGQHTGSDFVFAPVTVSTATTGLATGTGQNAMDSTETILASGTLPLLVQAHHGKGSICYLALDPTLEPIVGWSGASALWKGLLLRTLGEKALPAQYSYSPGGPSSSIDGLLQTLLPNTLPSPWLLLFLLLAYLAVLGPVRFLIVRSRKRRDWNWRIILSSIVVFSLLTYGLALHEKGTSILTNSISVIQLSSDSSAAHTTTYFGVFVPNSGNFQVHVADDSLIQPSPGDYYSGGAGASPQNTTITTTQDGTDVNLLGVDTWTLHSILSEQDATTTGRLVSHLTFQNNTLTGTVTNHLGYGLHDVYVLMPNSYVSIGNLTAGQTEQVNLTLNNAPPTPGMSLASKIASDNGLSPYYYGGYGSSQSLSETQRHIEILTALSGSGYFSGPCGGSCGQLPLLGWGSFSGSSYVVVRSSSVLISGSNTITFSGGGPPMSISPENDPLLSAGAPATLIGWANNTNPTGVIINGSTPAGVQETLIQAPLNVNFSGTLHLPTSLIRGQLINAEGNNTQVVGPGIYTMSTGSITFEFTLPSIAKFQVGSLTMTEPANLTQMVSPSSGPVTDGGQKAHIYNWRTHSWDAISLSSPGFTTSNTALYIGPGGRILVQYANSDSSLNTVVIGKPQLSVEGVI